LKGKTQEVAAWMEGTVLNSKVGVDHAREKEENRTLSESKKKGGRSGEESGTWARAVRNRVEVKRTLRSGHGGKKKKT